jgi:hypothetical protein
VDFLRAGWVAEVAGSAEPGCFVGKGVFVQVENSFTDKAPWVIRALKFGLDHAFAGAGATGVAQHQHVSTGDGFHAFGEGIRVSETAHAATFPIISSTMKSTWTNA